MIKSAINRIAIIKFQKVISLLCIVILVMFLTGCESKEEDATKHQVLKITITPTPVITPAPEEINPNAVVTKDGVTMINLYLLDHPDAVSGTESMIDSGERSMEQSYDEAVDEYDAEENSADVLTESVEDAHEAGDYEEAYEDYEE